jgi:acetyl esterase/lipase
VTTVRTESVSYGSHHAQVADLWRPVGNTARPVVVLIHGGFWRHLYTKRLMHGLARSVVNHGWAAYNIEYRRVGALGSGGWPATFDDVSAALGALAGIEGIDARRVVTCGHSAGGHLALWLGGDRRTGPDRNAPTVRPRAAVSLAGVVDLVAAARMGLGGGAVDALMGGAPADQPARYALGSPAALLPLGLPQVLIHGRRDSIVPPSLSEDYVAQASAAGDDARCVIIEGADHMDMISADGPAFDALAECLDRVVAPDALS